MLWASWESTQAPKTMQGNRSPTVYFITARVVFGTVQVSFTICITNREEKHLLSLLKDTTSMGSFLLGVCEVCVVL